MFIIARNWPCLFANAISHIINSLSLTCCIHDNTRFGANRINCTLCHDWIPNEMMQVFVSCVCKHFRILLFWCMTICSRLLHQTWYLVSNYSNAMVISKHLKYNKNKPVKNAELVFWFPKWIAEGSKQWQRNEKNKSADKNRDQEAEVISIMFDLSFKKIRSFS